MENETNCSSVGCDSTPTVAFVGAGNVATHLALAFVRKGVRITGIYSRTMVSAETLAEVVRATMKGDGNDSAVIATDCTVIATDALESLPDADVYIVSVKDDALPAVAAVWPADKKGRVVLHTAGSVAMDVMATASDHYGVLYPMQTFSKNKAVDFSKITAFVEGNDAVAEEAAIRLAECIFGRCRRLSSADRQYLHLAAVFACNFVNHMYDVAYDILKAQNIDPTCLLPLIAETAQKVESVDPHDVQTGPARRGDRAVVNRHIDALGNQPLLQQMYSMLSESIMQRYES